MLFNSFSYLVFLPVVVLLYWRVPNQYRPILLLIASYIFYSAWNPIYLLLIVGMTLVNWVFGLLIAPAVHWRKPLLVAAVLFNLATLCYYKYVNFIFSSIVELFHLVQLPAGSISGNGGAQISEAWHLNVILPLGISFFTFEFLHYVIEVFKGGQAVKNPIKFAVFAAFFPTQIAGPIKRYEDFIAQLELPSVFRIADLEKGFVMVLHGLAKKVLLADNLAIYVNYIYGAPGAATNLDLWMATYAFAFQVYCDFSGYTDVAIGSALMLGLRVPPNFNVPYMASSIRELWHRQHISLSNWFRDYVYFSLGGSRCSRGRVYINLLITTGLAGLWHGAAWHHVMWGLFQGLSLIINREWMRFYANIDWLKKFVHSKLWTAIAIFITFHAFCLSYVFFRADTNAIALHILGRMLRLWYAAPHGRPLFLSTQGPLIAPLIPFIIAVLVLAHILSEFLRRNAFWSKTPRPLQAIYCAFLIFMMITLMPDEANRFIYFQF